MAQEKPPVAIECLQVSVTFLDGSEEEFDVVGTPQLLPGVLVLNRRSVGELIISLTAVKYWEAKKSPLAIGR
jgi:hypothetical protein